MRIVAAGGCETDTTANDDVWDQQAEWSEEGRKCWLDGVVPIPISVSSPNYAHFKEQ